MIPIDLLTFIFFRWVETINQITNCIDTMVERMPWFLQSSRLSASRGPEAGRTQWRTRTWLRALLWAAAAGNGGKVWVFLEPSLVSWCFCRKRDEQKSIYGVKKQAWFPIHCPLNQWILTLECSTGGSWNNSGFPWIFQTTAQPHCFLLNLRIKSRAFELSLGCFDWEKCWCFPWVCHQFTECFGGEAICLWILLCTAQSQAVWIWRCVLSQARLSSRGWRILRPWRRWRSVLSSRKSPRAGQRRASPAHRGQPVPWIVPGRRARLRVLVQVHGILWPLAKSIAVFKPTVGWWLLGMLSKSIDRICWGWSEYPLGEIPQKTASIKGPQLGFWTPLMCDSIGRVWWNLMEFLGWICVGLGGPFSG